MCCHCCPLNSVAEKDPFGWDEKAEEAFSKLEIVVMQPLVLSLPDFTKVLTVEYDALESGIGAW